MTSFHSPIDLIVFGKKKTESESYKELSRKLSLLEYALDAQTKTIREINFHQPLLGVSDGEMKNEYGNGQRDHMDLVEEDAYSESETQPSSDDEDAFIEVASSDGSERSQSF